MENYIDILQIIFLVMGILLIMLEIIIPGFGIPGITGTIFLIVGVFLYKESMMVSLMYLVSAIIIACILGFIIGNILKVTGRLDNIVLDKKEVKTLENENSKYLGKQGKTKTILRPSGFMDIDGERVDVVTKGEYIPEDSLVEVVEVDGSSIIVRRV